MDVQLIIETLSQQPLWLGLLGLSASAMIEYIFPPFPGDAIVLAGAVLIPVARWPFAAVLGAVVLGSVLGAAINWRLGHVLGQHQRPAFLHRWLSRPNIAPKVEALEDRFRRHGSLYVCLNRFLPGFRAFFFVIAGKVGLPQGRVLAFGALSAALWSLALMGAGYLVGYNIERLVALMRGYGLMVWALIGAGALLWGVRFLWQRAKREQSA